MRNRKHKDTVAELINDIEQRKCATLVKRLGLDYITDTERYESAADHLRCLKECINIYYIVFAMQKNSLYKDYINRKITVFLESGIIQYWQTSIIETYMNETYMNSFFDATSIALSDPEPLSVTHLIGAFFLLLIGYLLALIAFLNEKFKIIRFRSTISDKNNFD